MGDELDLPALNELLALAAGYTLQETPAQLVELGLTGMTWRSPKGHWLLSGLPVFVKNLNAMREVEKEIEARGLCEQYLSALEDIAQPATCAFWNLVHATAEQRARAALAVLEAQGARNG